jgi:hypothetical protein
MLVTKYGVLSFQESPSSGGMGVEAIIAYPSPEQVKKTLGSNGNDYAPRGGPSLYGKGWR